MPSNSFRMSLIGSIFLMIDDIQNTRLKIAVLSIFLFKSVEIKDQTKIPNKKGYGKNDGHL